jgi:hypothetical protein
MSLRPGDLNPLVHPIAGLVDGEFLTTTHVIQWLNRPLTAGRKWAIFISYTSTA